VQTGLTAASVALGLTSFVVFLFSTTLHEASHALIAYKLGDPTAYHGGQVTLNPLPHIRREPVGMVLIPLLTFATQGWMMGWASAPYDPLWAQRFPRRAAAMALAGPAANLLLVLLAALGIHAGMALGAFAAPAQVSFTEVTVATGPDGGIAAGIATALSLLFSLNLVLFVFNLLPLPPLDGSAVVPAFLSGSAAARYNELLRQPMLSLLGLLVAWRLFGPLYRPLEALALNLLYPGLSYG
jgi:Zn-dependent protease